MKQISAPLAWYDEISVHEIIKSSRKPAKPRLLALQTEVGKAVIRYRQRLRDGHCASFFVVAEEVRDAYYALYDSRSVRVIRLKEDIWSLLGNDLCPYCSVDTTEDLDHYLPRGVFPELSISAQNLVPSCGICNSGHKRSLWENGLSRPVLHPYFDYIPSVQFLKCDVSVRPGALIINFSITHPIPIAGGVMLLIQQHFTTMDLNGRYIKKVSSEEVPKISNLLASKPTKRDKYKELATFVRQQRVAFTINSWGNAFYSALTNCHIRAICRML